MKTDSVFTSQIRVKVQEEAKRRQENAAYGGEWGDGGAQNLLDQLETWIDGLNGVVPSVFIKFADQIMIEQDPEYSEYKRLKEKFKAKL